MRVQIDSFEMKECIQFITDSDRETVFDILKKTEACITVVFQHVPYLYRELARYQHATNIIFVWDSILTQIRGQDFVRDVRGEDAVYQKYSRK